MADKRVNPGDDMLSRLTEATIDVRMAVRRRSPIWEITGFAGLLGGAGAETVTKLIGNAIVLFQHNPGQWQRVVEEPGIDSRRRWRRSFASPPPSQYQGRYSVEERTFEGGTIPAGFPVLLITGVGDSRSVDVRPTR